MLAIMVMAAASGYPNQLTESALQAWLKDSHVSNTTIGVMSYVALPYLLKFLWAPFVDRFPMPFLGRRRGWILVTQILLAVAIAFFALQDPAVALFPVAACAVTIVFLSATQDISIDAYRTDVSLPSERGPAAAASNLGYRTAAWLASAVALLIADQFAWRPAFLILAGIMMLFCISTWLAPEPAQVQQAPRSLRETVVIPLQELLAGPGAVALIGVVLLFKIGDAFAMKLFTPFMLDIGFSKTELAVIVKGLNNYLCLRRYGEFRTSPDAIEPRYEVVEGRVQAGGFHDLSLCLDVGPEGHHDSEERHLQERKGRRDQVRCLIPSGAEWLCHYVPSPRHPE